MSGEIKLYESEFSAAKNSFDGKRETISTEKNVYDSGRDTLYRSWKGQAMNACVSITNKLNTDYLKIISDAETLSKDLEITLKSVQDADKAAAETYKAAETIDGGK